MRLVLKNCGHIDAENMDEYIAVGGYQALEKVLFEMTPEDVVEEISESGLRGRGGGGFQTGYKWRQVARQKTEEKYRLQRRRRRSGRVYGPKRDGRRSA